MLAHTHQGRGCPVSAPQPRQLGPRPAPRPSPDRQGEQRQGTSSPLPSLEAELTGAAGAAGLPRAGSGCRRAACAPRRGAARCRANASPVEPGAEPLVGPEEGRGGRPLLWAGGVALAAGLGYAALHRGTLVPYIRARFLASKLHNSGLFAAFSLIFLSEIGDKTFFLAGLLAAKLGRWVSFVGSMFSLSFMTVVSVTIGFAFKSVPDTVKSSVPVGQILGTVMMLYFGLTTLNGAFQAPKVPAGGAGEEEEGDEMQAAERSLRDAETGGRFAGKESLWGALSAVAALIFVAEWGDRSMMATIALGAAQSPAGVAVGAILGHGVATAIAVICGALAAKYISERTISKISGVLYLFFAAATALGYM